MLLEGKTYTVIEDSALLVTMPSFMFCVCCLESPLILKKSPQLFTVHRAQQILYIASSGWNILEPLVTSLGVEFILLAHSGRICEVTA